MRKIKFALSSCIFLLCFLLTFSAIQANEEIWVDREIYANPIFAKAYFYECSWNFREALRAYWDIVEQYPGTEYDANARLCRIAILHGREGFIDHEGYLGELRSLRDNFPNTRYWLIAREEILKDENRDKTFEEWLPIINDLITEMGGKNVFDILNENKKDDNYDPSQIAPPYRSELAEIYYGICVVYRCRGEAEKGLKLALFVRENFPQFTRIDIVNSYQISTIREKEINDFSAYQNDSPPPLFRIISPADDAKIREDQPRIEFELKSGDLGNSQIDLPKLQFTLDGQDLIPKMKIKSTLDISGKPKVPFETIKIYYTPEQPLAPGPHTVYVKAMDNDKLVRQKTWTFKIQ